MNSIVHIEMEIGKNLLRHIIPKINPLDSHDLLKMTLYSLYYHISSVIRFFFILLKQSLISRSVL